MHAALAARCIMSGMAQATSRAGESKARARPAQRSVKWGGVLPARLAYSTSTGSRDSRPPCWLPGSLLAAVVPAPGRTLAGGSLSNWPPAREMASRMKGHDITNSGSLVRPVPDNITAPRLP